MKMQKSPLLSNRIGLSLELLLVANKYTGNQGTNFIDHCKTTRAIRQSYCREPVADAPLSRRTYNDEIALTHRKSKAFDPLSRDYFKPLKGRCPQPGCKNRDKIICWRLEGCNGQMEVNCYGQVRCAKHPKELHSLIACKFSCQEHTGVFVAPDWEDMLQADTVISMVEMTTEDRLWNATFKRSLKFDIEQRKKKKAAQENPFF